MSFPFDNNVHDLRLGNSFDRNSNTAFHSIRYDFKPASVDTTKEAHVEVSKGQVTVTVPHVEESSTSHTVFKGNTQPSQRECVLIIDHETGTFTLEKLSAKITVKKSRLDGSSKSMQWIQQNGGRITPSDKKAKKKTGSKVKAEKISSPEREKKSSPEAVACSITPLHSETSKAAEDIAELGEITSDSSSSSDSDEDMPDAPPASMPYKPAAAPPASMPYKPTAAPPPSMPSMPSMPATAPASHSMSKPSSQPGPPGQPRNHFGVLNNDLALSESDDSDSD